MVWIAGMVQGIASSYASYHRDMMDLHRSALDHEHPGVVRCRCGHSWSLLADISTRHSCRCYACPFREVTPFDDRRSGTKWLKNPRAGYVCAYCDTPRPNYMKRCQSCGAMETKR